MNLFVCLLKSFASAELGAISVAMVETKSINKLEARIGNSSLDTGTSSI